MILASKDGGKYHMGSVNSLHHNDISDDVFREKIMFMKGILNEKQYRQFLANEAIALGRGGRTKICALSGSSLSTIRKGINEVNAAKAASGKDDDSSRVRRRGGGRKAATAVYPNLKDAIQEIVDDKTYGNPERVLVWTTYGLMEIARLLGERYGIHVSHMVVSSVLEDLGYSKQANQKMLQTGKPHPDRDSQFLFINETSRRYIDAGDPVISIDCKKKENIGNFKNPGQEYRPKKDPRRVFDHDFLIKELGHVAPYGIYDVDKNTGFINLGTSHDTAEFAVNSIYQWWLHIGKGTYPRARRIFVTCDGGGSNGSRIHLWKAQIADLAEKTGLEVQISHFPPGTSKWNKIEHRLFCFISRNWEGQPLIDVETVIKLIGSTTTEAGLKVKCVLDNNTYETGIHVSDEQYENILIERIEPMTDWNYIIKGYKK